MNAIKGTSKYSSSKSFSDQIGYKIYTVWGEWGGAHSCRQIYGVTIPLTERKWPIYHLILCCRVFQNKFQQ